MFRRRSFRVAECSPCIADPMPHICFVVVVGGGGGGGGVGVVVAVVIVFFFSSSLFWRVLWGYYTDQPCAFGTCSLSYLLIAWRLKRGIVFSPRLHGHQSCCCLVLSPASVSLRLSTLCRLCCMLFFRRKER